MEELQQSLFVEDTDEKRAFKLLQPELEKLLDKLWLDDSFIKFKEVKDYSSMYFLNDGYLLGKIRLRKKNWYVSLSEDYIKFLPPEATYTHSSGSEIRVNLNNPNDILLCKDAIGEALRVAALQFHTCDCCGLYESCSDARRCVNSDRLSAAGCSYRKNLLEGRIFYGKNKNI